MTWAEVSARLGRNDLPMAMIENWWSMPRSEQARAIADAWTMAEWPSQIMDTNLWDMLFSIVTDGHYIVGDDGELILRDTLPATMTLYRGAFDDFVFGMSWTTNLEKADWFAHRLEHGSHRGRVYETTASRDDVFAKFDRRGEFEIVLRSTRIGGVVEVLS